MNGTCFAKDHTSNREEASPEEVAAMGGARPLRGLECRDCGCADFSVIQTRKQEGQIYRQRACRHCGRRVTTIEKVI